MGAYEKFAQVYDLFMDNIDYEEWADYITDHLKKYGIEDGLVLELGCGTGTMTGLLADRGYDMIGVDNSGEMLAEAMEKRMESGQDILYLQQDMQEFELYGTVRAIVSVCDSLNYITEREELLQVFRLVNNYLDPEGLFLFDSFLKILQYILTKVICTNILILIIKEVYRWKIQDCIKTSQKEQMVIFM